MNLSIRPAEESDWPEVLRLFGLAAHSGEVFAYDESTTDETALALWVKSPSRGFVAEREGHVVGTYFLRPNQPGRGSHVANAGYIVDPVASRQGIATAMCLHSLQTARELGFLSMQFNFVISTNRAAIRVWEKCGFEIVGRLPEAFRHREKGLVDALIFSRKLT